MGLASVLADEMWIGEEAEAAYYELMETQADRYGREQGWPDFDK